MTKNEPSGMSHAKAIENERDYYRAALERIAQVANGTTPLYSQRSMYEFACDVLNWTPIPQRAGEAA